jgi:predicted phage terminase large subunit-like protein
MVIRPTSEPGTRLVLRLPKPLPHTLTVLASPARWKVVVCGRRWSKTASGLQMAIRGHGPDKIRRGALDGGNIWWVMPTFPDATEVWRDLKRACKGVWVPGGKSERERRIELPGGGSITIKSADNPDSLRGRGLDGLVMDEAASIDEAAWKEALRPALADKHGWCVWIGTPKGMNWFHDLFERAGNEGAAAGWERWQRPTSDNPLIDPAEIADARKEMGSLRASQELDAQFVNFGGGVFRREWFPIVPELPALASRACRYWDKAATEGGGDYSAGVLVVEHGRLFYIVDVRRGRWSSATRESQIDQTAEIDALRFEDLSIWVEQEPGSGGKESAEITVRRLAGLKVKAERVTGEKTTRWGPLAAQAEAGNVVLVRGAWNKEFLDEIEAVPEAAHDDQADAASGAFNKLARKKQFSIGAA